MAETQFINNHRPIALYELVDFVEYLEHTLVNLLNPNFLITHEGSVDIREDRIICPGIAMDNSRYEMCLVRLDEVLKDYRWHVLVINDAKTVKVKNK